MPEISILLPSLRKEAAIQRIQEFAQTNGKMDYEIILVSPFAVEEARVLHVREEKRRGGIHALNSAYGRASAPFVTWWSDDAWPTMNCLAKMLRFIVSRKDPFLGCFRLKSRHGEEFEQWSVYGKLYASWGMASRKSIQAIGGFLDPVFKRFWSDPDMSLRAWVKGGRVEICPNAWVVISHIEDEVKLSDQQKYFNVDAETFLSRWHERLGEGKPRPLDWREINYPIPIKRRPSFRFMIGAVTNKIPGMKRAKESLKRVLFKK